jgi:pimeloyl-ACP methyl ester carboxylesterase
MPSVTLDGQAFWYEDSGGRGPAVVWSHGFLMDREMFAPNIAALAPRYRCIAWDQRGFGKTGPAAGPFTYWDSARDVLGLLDHLGLEAAALVGMSQGGFLSMRAALLDPRRVTALGLIATRSGHDGPDVIATFQALRREWCTNGCANVKDMMAALLLGTGYDAAPWTAKWEAIPKESMGWPIDALAGRDDITARLPEITCPAIVFHGDADLAIDLAHGEALARSLPRCMGFVRVPGAGHAANLTHPQSINPPLAEFLAATL